MSRCEMAGCHGLGTHRVRGVLLSKPQSLLICEKCFKRAERRNYNKIEDLRYALCKAVRLLVCVQKAFPEAFDKKDMKEIQKILKASSIPEDPR